MGALDVRADNITESLLPFEFTQAATLNGFVATILSAVFNLSVSLPLKAIALLKRTPLTPAVGQISGVRQSAGLATAALLAKDIAPLASSNDNRTMFVLGDVSVGNGVLLAVGEYVRVRVGEMRDALLMYF